MESVMGVEKTLDQYLLNPIVTVKGSNDIGKVK